ncbi:EF-hand domain-containing protein [Mariniblastus fucicola]|uniref:EF hand n=1 Tax=Mariniblastus fucicola TaxID=980251 RepID=A0A5B9PKF8_9BACT|nr:EF-hand domain-containing protein [Mariniblastus fucicola]QEG23151.1 EF hand [Mariniblastus fucicola]
MNGIRLAVLAIAALGFLQIELSEAMGQQGRGPSRADIERMRRQNDADRDRGNRTDRDQDDEDEDSSPRSSRSSSDNAIESNPLLQLFDTNGDGELSLEEIDAASRLLYSLDTNRDNTITSEEVKDMIADGGSSRESSRGSTRGSSNRSDRSTARSSNRDRGSRSERGGSGNASRGQSFNLGGGRGGAKKGGGVPAIGMASPATAGDGNKAAEDDFAAHDRDNDGVLKRGEMPRTLRTKFTKMDTNGDKEIDEDEFYDYIDNQ